MRLGPQVSQELLSLPLSPPLQIAHHCYKETQNYNSMFAITSGLDHGAVKRLRQTWEKVPGKYLKLVGGSELHAQKKVAKKAKKNRKTYNMALCFLLCPTNLHFFFTVVGRKKRHLRGKFSFLLQLSEMQTVMDPSMNFRKYRNLLSNARVSSSNSHTLFSHLFLKRSGFF